MRISDPTAIRALAHPLRLDLLELLATISPATAAQCGRVLGVSQASCSFHLRQLAKYGFVEEAGPGSDRRERQWQVPDAQPAIRISSDTDTVVKRQLERVVVEREFQAMHDHLDRGKDASMISAIALLSAEDVAEIKEKWKAILEPYLAKTQAHPQPGQRYVRYFMAATPILEDAS
jgi:predicted ArsR family transcriptional regulator